MAPITPSPCAIVHYHEISLKRGNRPLFLRHLQQNIRRAIGDLGPARLVQLSGRIMLDLTEGRILYAVLSFGGFLGVGDKLFPVPVDALQWRVDSKGGLDRCLVDIDKETLKSAPGYKKDELPSTADRTFASKVYTHYGFSPYWED